MVKNLTIGVIGIQGAISEHVYSMKKALLEKNQKGIVKIVRYKEDLKNIDGVILPGGESTTISNVLFKKNLYNSINNRIKKNNLPIMGTCAGCVLLSKKISQKEGDIKLLKAMNMKVSRNAFGRQKESFEHIIDIKGFKKKFPAVFIRAPIIEDTWGDCKPLAYYNKNIVMAKQDKFLALSFHPELTNDNSIHNYFLEEIIKEKK